MLLLLLAVCSHLCTRLLLASLAQCRQQESASGTHAPDRRLCVCMVAISIALCAKLTITTTTVTTTTRSNAKNTLTAIITAKHCHLCLRLPVSSQPTMPPPSLHQYSGRWQQQPTLYAHHRWCVWFIQSILLQNFSQALFVGCCLAVHCCCCIVIVCDFFIVHATESI